MTVYIVQYVQVKSLLEGGNGLSDEDLKSRFESSGRTKMGIYAVLIDQLRMYRDPLLVDSESELKTLIQKLIKDATLAKCLPREFKVINIFEVSNTF